MNSDELTAAVAQIEQLARAGQMEAAEQAARQTVARWPREHQAWLWIAVLRLSRREGTEAEAAARQAVAIAPHEAQAWNLLSLALRLQVRLAEAEGAAREALSRTDSWEYWSGLGHCLFEQQKWDAAIGAYELSLARQPQQADAWTNLGLARQSLGQLELGLAAFERAVQLVPRDQNAWLRYGLLQYQCGRFEQAVAAGQRILQVDARSLSAWLLIGNSERSRDNFAAAEAAYRQAVQISPQDRNARYNLGLILLQNSQYCEAERWARQLVDENPHDAEALMILSAAYLSQGRAEEAIVAMRRASELRLDPMLHSKYLGALHYAASVTLEQSFQAHRQWDERYASRIVPLPPTPARAPGKKIRLGFIGLDFCNGPTGFLGLLALECLDKSQCSIVLYADRLLADSYTARFQAIADNWRVVLGLSDEQLADEVRRDEIDVLVDLAGHVGRRLLVFARRPAPLQVSWLGYTGTTGLSAMDGLIADRFHVRSSEELFHTESVLRMPHDYICYGPPPDAPPTGPLPALENGYFTFGCFSNPAKFSPSLLDAWAEILQSVPTSRLFLKYGGLHQPEAQSRIRQELGRRQIAGERVMFEGWSPNLDVLARYNRVDLALDTQPYSGGLTTCEALWMGVPVVTCPGWGFASRHSTSHLTNAGYDQFVAADWPGYVGLATHWANQVKELAMIRLQMRPAVAASPLCDAPAFARDFLMLLRDALATKEG